MMSTKSIGKFLSDLGEVALLPSDSGSSLGVACSRTRGEPGHLIHDNSVVTFWLRLRLGSTTPDS